jgi:HAD superfamily hydrolase (TIGR01509 family)
MKLDPTRVTTILFDVDGTLYHQGGLRRAMLGRLLMAAIANPFAGVTTFRALQAYRKAQESLRGAEVEGALASAHLRLACEQCGAAEEVVAQAVGRWMEKEPLALLERFVDPALRAFLSAARARGVRLGVFSDYPAATKLHAMGLTEFFDVIVAAQDAAVNRFKPHPSGLLEALRRLDAAPDRALYVGDRHEVDGAAARAAGVPCIIVGRRSLPAASEGWIAVSDYTALHAMLFPSASKAHP